MTDRSKYLRGASVPAFALRNDTDSTSYTLAAADEGANVRFTSTSAVTVSLPQDSAVDFPLGTRVLLTKQAAGDTVTIQAGAGASIQGSIPVLSETFETTEVVKAAPNAWRSTYWPYVEYGQIYIRGGSTTQVTNASSGTFDTVSGWNTAAGANGLSSAGVTPDKANNKLTLVTTGLYQVLLSFSFQGHSPTANVYTLRCSLDGTPQDQLYVQRATSSGDVGSCSFSGIIDVDSASEDLIVEVACTNNSQDFTPIDSQLTVIRIGDT